MTAAVVAHAVCSEAGGVLADSDVLEALQVRCQELGSPGSADLSVASGSTGVVVAALAQVRLRGTRSPRRTAFPAEGTDGSSTPEATP